MFHKFRTVTRVALVASPFALFATVAHAETEKIKTKGVFIWGDNSQGLISPAPADMVVREPVSIPYFQGKSLKDLAISPQVAVAVLSNGQTVQWTAPGEEFKVLSNETIEQVAVWDDLVVARSKGGNLYTWHAASSSHRVQKIKLPSLGWFEKVVDFKIGRDHITARTSKGKVLTGLTREIPHHLGQLGIAQLSAFDAAPPANEMYIVKLLKDKKVTKIACGEEHSMFLTDKGEVYGCGSNLFGQLAIPFNYNLPNHSVPTLAKVKDVVDVAAGACVTYFLTASKDVDVVGNGINGLFGTGSFANMQDFPIHLRSLEHLSEFNEKTNSVEAIVPARWSISNTHVFMGLSNAGADWYLWGSGLCGQLGTGKLSRVVKPTHVRNTPLNEVVADTLVAGNGISAAYSKA